MAEAEADGGAAPVRPAESEGTMGSMDSDSDFEVQSSAANSDLSSSDSDEPPLEYGGVHGLQLESGDACSCRHMAIVVRRGI